MALISHFPSALKTVVQSDSIGHPTGASLWPLHQLSELGQGPAVPMRREILPFRVIYSSTEITDINCLVQYLGHRR